MATPRGMPPSPVVRLWCTALLWCCAAATVHDGVYAVLYGVHKAQAQTTAITQRHRWLDGGSVEIRNNSLIAILDEQTDSFVYTAYERTDSDPCSELVQTIPYIADEQQGRLFTMFFKPAHDSATAGKTTCQTLIAFLSGVDPPAGGLRNHYEIVVCYGPGPMGGYESAVMWETSGVSISYAVVVHDVWNYITITMKGKVVTSTINGVSLSPFTASLLWEGASPPPLRVQIGCRDIAPMEPRRHIYSGGATSALGTRLHRLVMYDVSFDENVDTVCGDSIYYEGDCYSRQIAEGGVGCAASWPDPEHPHHEVEMQTHWDAAVFSSFSLGSTSTDYYIGLKQDSAPGVVPSTWRWTESNTSLDPKLVVWLQQNGDRDYPITCATGECACWQPDSPCATTHPGSQCASYTTLGFGLTRTPCGFLNYTFCRWPATHSLSTDSPPTTAPPTNAPPTNAPPTDAPPTDAPPIATLVPPATPAPASPAPSTPTPAPDSDAPPTNAPVSTPSPDWRTRPPACACSDGSFALSTEIYCADVVAAPAGRQCHLRGAQGSCRDGFLDCAPAAATAATVPQALPADAGAACGCDAYSAAAGPLDKVLCVQGTVCSLPHANGTCAAGGETLCTLQKLVRVSAKPNTTLDADDIVTALAMIVGVPPPSIRVITVCQEHLCPSGACPTELDARTEAGCSEDFNTTSVLHYVCHFFLFLPPCSNNPSLTHRWILTLWACRNSTAFAVSHCSTTLLRQYATPHPRFLTPLLHTQVGTADWDKLSPGVRWGLRRLGVAVDSSTLVMPPLERTIEDHPGTTNRPVPPTRSSSGTWLNVLWWALGGTAFAVVAVWLVATKTVKWDRWVNFNASRRGVQGCFRQHTRNWLSDDELCIDDLGVDLSCPLNPLEPSGAVQSSQSTLCYEMRANCDPMFPSTPASRSSSESSEPEIEV